MVLQTPPHLSSACTPASGVPRPPAYWPYLPGLDPTWTVHPPRMIMDEVRRRLIGVDSPSAVVGRARGLDEAARQCNGPVRRNCTDRPRPPSSSAFFGTC